MKLRIPLSTNPSDESDVVFIDGIPISSWTLEKLMLYVYLDLVCAAPIGPQITSLTMEPD